MYKLVVVLRYMRRNWLNLVGILAVAIGVLVLICVLSVMKGFDEEMRNRIRGTLSDLTVESWNDTFSNYEAIIAKLEKYPEVAACAPVFEGLGLVKLRDKSRYCQFIGIDLERALKTTEFGSYWRAWRSRVAAERLTKLLTSKEETTPPTEAGLVALLEQMRKIEYEDLSPETRKAIANIAPRIDLQKCFDKAAAELPAWPEVADEHVSPVFLGQQMMILGYMDDQLVSVQPGDQVVLVTLPPGTNLNLEDRITRRAVVAGGFHSGMSEQDYQNLYLPLADVQKIMSKPGEVTNVIIKLKSFKDAELVRCKIVGILTPEEMESAITSIAAVAKDGAAAEIKMLGDDLANMRLHLGDWHAAGDIRPLTETTAIARRILALPASYPNQPLSGPVNAFAEKLKAREKEAINRMLIVKTWEEQRRTLFRALVGERRILGFILLFIILIAGFLILSILHTTVLSRTRDIGTLKALGGSVQGIMALFLLNGFFIGIIGSVLGAVGGALITSHINDIEAFLTRLTGFKLFPPDIYYLDRIPVDQHPLFSILLISGLALAASVLASAYPAWKASRMDAVEALRYE